MENNKIEVGDSVLPHWGGPMMEVINIIQESREDAYAICSYFDKVDGKPVRAKFYLDSLKLNKKKVG